MASFSIEPTSRGFWNTGRERDGWFGTTVDFRDRRMLTEVMGALDMIMYDMPKAAYIAMGRAAENLRVRIIDKVEDISNIPHDYVVQAVHVEAPDRPGFFVRMIGGLFDTTDITRQSHEDLTVKVSIEGKPVPLIAFPTHVQGRRGLVGLLLGRPRGGLYAAVRRDGAPEYHPRAFVMKGNNLHPFIAQRRFVSRLPIKEVFGPSVKQLVDSTPGMQDDIERTARIAIYEQLLDVQIQLNEQMHLKWPSIR